MTKWRLKEDIADFFSSDEAPLESVLNMLPLLSHPSGHPAWLETEDTLMSPVEFYLQRFNLTKSIMERVSTIMDDAASVTSYSRNAEADGRWQSRAVVKVLCSVDHPSCVNASLDHWHRGGSDWKAGLRHFRTGLGEKSFLSETEVAGMALRHGSPEDKERVAALLRQESSPSLALDVAGYSTNESLVDEIVRLHYNALSTEEYDHMVTGNLRKAVLRVTLSFTAEELQRLPLEVMESGPCSFSKLIDNEEELKRYTAKLRGFHCPWTKVSQEMRETKETLAKLRRDAAGVHRWVQGQLPPAAETYV
ncbi:uncharacterized protein LOC8040774 [Ixodes scapularis]|uniref:uncharacterized protein LOC8040774 n=1 Tax=Ixodes scapularis TaxID=6945 RepID=UPI001C38CECE|nr:uncharacterized protein LOC8040774 [Ixodes scapularis]